MCHFCIFNRLIHTYNFMSLTFMHFTYRKFSPACMHVCVFLYRNLDDANTKAQDVMQSTLTSTRGHSIRVTACHAEICQQMKLCVDFIGEVLPLVHGLACICGLQMQCYIKAALQIVSCAVFCMCVCVCFSCISSATCSPSCVFSFFSILPPAEEEI